MPPLMLLTLVVEVADTGAGLQPASPAAGASQGLALALDLRPDIVFVDIRLPGLDGLSLARRLKGLTPIVFVPAYDAHAIQAFERGAIDYLLKPLAEA